jgi:hypothetical protein
MKSALLFSVIIVGEIVVAVFLFAEDTMGVRFGPGELAVVGGLLSGVVAALVYVGRLLIAAKDAQLEKALEDIKDYRAIAADGAKAAIIALAARNAASGQISPPELAPVVPERHSEVTQEQKEAALKATLRAQVTSVMLALGEKPRTLSDDAAILAPALTPEVHVGDKVKVMVEGEIVPEVPPPK